MQLPSFVLGKPRVQEIWVVLPLTRPECVSRAALNFERQRFRKKLVVVCPEGLNLGSLRPEVVVRGSYEVGAARAAGNESVPKDAYVVTMDDDDWYGPRYLAEHASLARPGRLVGKQLHWVDFDGYGLTLLRPETHSKPVEFLAGGTIGGFASEIAWPKLSCSEDMALCRNFLASGGEVLHSSLYHVRYKRERDPRQHTYRALPYEIVSEQGGGWFYRFRGVDEEKLICGEIREPQNYGRFPYSALYHITRAGS